MEIKLIGSNLNGVWSNPKIYVNKQSKSIKSFSKYDQFAIEILRKKNIPIAILTSENDISILKMAKILNIENVYINEQEKLKRMKYLCKKMNINIDQVAYIGNDLNDLDILNNVKISGAPVDSPIINYITPSIITKRIGGEGAFREFVDKITDINPIDDFINKMLK